MRPTALRGGRTASDAGVLHAASGAADGADDEPASGPDEPAAGTGSDTAPGTASGAGGSERAGDEDPFARTGEASTSMVSVLRATDEDVVAVSLGTPTTAGYRELYGRLVEATTVHDTVHLYEETVDWTVWTYLSNVREVAPGITFGPDLDVGRYALVGNSLWARLRYLQRRAVSPVFPVSPDEMRRFDVADREAALAWVRDGEP